MLTEFGVVFFFILLGCAFIFAALFAGSLFRPQKPGPIKLSPYECGEQVVGHAFIRFNIRFYMIALIFLIFDVEVVVLFPLATQYLTSGPLVFLEVLAFAGVLLAGLLYVWRKGDLEWVKTARGA